MEKIIEILNHKKVDFKNPMNKVQLVKHIYENFDSYFRGGQIITQDFVANPDYKPSDYSREKTLRQPKVATDYTTKIIDKFWSDLLKHTDIISKMYRNSTDDGSYIYKVKEVSRWRRTLYEFTKSKVDFGDGKQRPIIEMIKFHLADQIAMHMYSAWEDYDKYQKVKTFIQQFNETPIVEKRRNYYTNSDYNGVLQKDEVKFDDDVWSADRDRHSIILSFGVSSYGHDVGKLLEVTFNFVDADRGLLYKQKGEINLHYHVEGSRWDENRTLSLLTGELKKKYVSGLGNKIVNYQLEDKFGETSRKVNFTTCLLYTSDAADE